MHTVNNIYNRKYRHRGPLTPELKAEIERKHRNNVVFVEPQPLTFQERLDLDRNKRLAQNTKPTTTLTEPERQVLAARQYLQLKEKQLGNCDPSQKRRYQILRDEAITELEAAEQKLLNTNSPLK